MRGLAPKRFALSSHAVSAGPRGAAQSERPAEPVTRGAPPRYSRVMLQATLAALVFALTHEPLASAQTPAGASSTLHPDFARSPLKRALEASRAHCRPALVFAVAPTLEGRRCQSRWLADLLAAGDAEVLRDLALVELAFATVEQLAEIDAAVGLARRAGSAALFEWIEGALVATPIALSSDPWCGATIENPSKLGPEMERAAREMASALRGDRDAVRRRADVVRARLTSKELQSVRESIEADMNPGRDVIERGAWIYCEGDIHSRAWDALLALVGEERLLRRPLLGARWFDSRPGELTVHFADFDGADERIRLVERASAERSAFGRLEVQVGFDSDCGGGPCGTGFSSTRSYRFLDEYVRGLVFAPESE